MTDRRSSARIRLSSSAPPDPLTQDPSGRLCRWVATVEIVALVATGRRDLLKARMATHGSTLVQYLPSARAGYVREAHYRALVASRPAGCDARLHERSGT